MDGADVVRQSSSSSTCFGSGPDRIGIFARFCWELGLRQEATAEHVPCCFFHEKETPPLPKKRHTASGWMQGRGQATGSLEGFLTALKDE